MQVEVVGAPRRRCQRGGDGLPGAGTGKVTGSVLSLPRQRLRGEMARRVLALALCLSLAAVASADCVTQCSLCAARTRGTESSVQPLVSANPAQSLAGGVVRAAGVSRVLVHGQQSWVLPWWWLWAPQGAGNMQGLALR